MNNHYDAALIGIWWGSNYGSCLNGYAVYHVLKRLGLSVLLVNKHNASENDWELADTHNGRFMRKFYPPEDVSPVIPFNRLHELNDIVDTFITGSDQIWNYNINRSFDMAFLQNFVDGSKRQISFATSFGHDFDKTPPEILPQNIKLMNRYNAISVREKSGVNICREIYGVNASVVVEPVFCLDKSDYLELAKHSELEEEGPYILTYILDPTPEKRRAIEYYCKVSGMKALNVLDGNHAHYEKNKANLNLPNIMGKIGAEDFMKLYINASFVISDSFHGTAFAIIFNKPFLSITNRGRGAARFGELLSKFGLTDRLAQSQKSIPEDPRFFEEIDYGPVNEKIKEERDKSIEWLKKALTTPLEELPPVSIADNAVTAELNKKLCVGCGACASACPKDALEVSKDNSGFYRCKINYNRCINCGLCKTVCPALELPENRNEKQQECFEYVSSDDSVLRASSSGGVFTAMSRKILEQGGVVFGAGWREDFSVAHMMIEKEEDLHRIQKSKYLQSYMGNTFRRVKEKLEENIPVLFSGCPCQIAGLKKFLKKDYHNLYLIDILCSYAPPVNFFQKYVREQFGDDIAAYEFRHKTKNWNWDCMTVKITNNAGDSIVRHGTAEDPYQKAYHNHLMTGIHCENCKYQSGARLGDITIGDFWGISKRDPKINAKKGVSMVMCNNEKGKKLFDSLVPSDAQVRKAVPAKWVGNNGFMVTGKNYANKKRDEFYRAVGRMSFADAVKYVLEEQENGTEKINPMQFSSRSTHFRFDRNVWEENCIKGLLTLSVAPGMAKPGRYAMLPLYKPLKAGKKYNFSIRFRIKSESEYINFHVINSKTKQYQIIQTYKIFVSPENWIEISKEFVPGADGYDAFMIGASQLLGDDNYFILDEINITEK